MPRSRMRRLVATWLACWLPLVLLDGGWLHACPMHDGGGAAAVHEMAAMVQPGEHGGVGAGHAPHSGRPAAAHLCTCLGACCAAVAVLPVGPAPVAVAVVERATVVFTGRPEHEYVAAWVDFVLPFATAPPLQG